MALLSGGRVDEILIERAHRPWRIGSIVLARVTAVRRELGAVFLDLAGDDGYLDGFSGPIPNEGKSVLVEITSEAHRGKAARVTTDLSLQGELITMTPHRPDHAISRRITAKGERSRLRAALGEVLPETLGAIVGPQAKGCEIPALLADAHALLDRWQRMQALIQAPSANPAPQILQAAPGPVEQARRAAPDATVREGRDGALFLEHDIEATIAQATQRRVTLDSGAALVFDEGEALTAIDIDVARSQGATENPITLASESAQAIARQIRLRRLAGLILIDFPRTRIAAAREKWSAKLKQATTCGSDPLTIHGWTRAGLLEITRPRRGPSLRETLLEDDPALQPNVNTLALEALRHVLRGSSGIAHPRLKCSNAVRLALLGPLRPAFDEVGRRLGARLTLEPDQ
ncbi:MAG: ribonuclease E/G [Proteobacteria bacterium]|nr:ribonuclease E/G [Pseudomonadota bacterium]